MTRRVKETRLAWAWALATGGVATGALVGACSSSSTGDSPGGTSTDASPDEAVVEAGPIEAVADVDAGAEASTPADGGADGSVVDCSDAGAMPNDLACTGLYSDWATKTIAPDAVAYTPGLVFWSDGAVKTRWLYLPPGSKIDTSDMDNWVFPVGTKVWKQFALAGQIVETRLISKDDSGWNYLDYRWSADQSTATLFEDGETNVNGTTYEIPSPLVCAQCHGGRADAVLGIDLLGLGVPGAQGITLASLAAQGTFTTPPPATSVTVPEDATKKAAAALGWLHVNCGSSCHNPLGRATATQLYMKLLAGELYPADGGTARVDALDTYTTAVNVTGKVMPGGATLMRIAPGDAAHSLVPLMALSRDGDGGLLPMPPLVSHIPDTTGEAAVSAWISALGDAGDAGH
jgi:hypothetical protein